MARGGPLAGLTISTQPQPTRRAGVPRRCPMSGLGCGRIRRGCPYAYLAAVAGRRSRLLRRQLLEYCFSDAFCARFAQSAVRAVLLPERSGSCPDDYTEAIFRVLLVVHPCSLRLQSEHASAGANSADDHHSSARGQDRLWRRGRSHHSVGRPHQPPGQGA